MQDAAEYLLLVDDDEIFCEVLAGALVRRGFTVEVAHDVNAARESIARRMPQFAIIDLRIGNDSGLALVEQLNASEAPVKTVVLTGFGSIATAVTAIKQGAQQYLTKPAAVDDIVAALIGGEGQDDELDLDTARPPSVKRLEWEHIQRVLHEHDGNVSATARALGMHRRTLQRKLLKRPVRS